MSAEQSIRVRQLGEVEFNRRQFALALDWIRKHPTQFVSFTLKHFQLFWTFRSRFVPLLPLAFVGLIILLNQDRPSFYLIALVWVLYPLVYYLVPFAPRYRHPIEWTVVVTAALAVQVIFDKAARTLQSRRRDQLGSANRVPASSSV